jgi:hypothetical protein
MTEKHPNENTSYITIGSGHPIDADVVIINGVEYKKVDEPKSRTLFIEILNKTGGRYDPRITKEFIDIMKEWLPYEIEHEDGDYDEGWNNALRTIKDKLR